MTRVLVIAAHPDDEILGCGGTVAKHVASGDEVQVIIAAEGLTSRGEGASEKELEALKEISKRANEILGVKKINFLDCPDNMMDLHPLLDTIKKIEKIMDSYRPNIIYTHHTSDLNVDHRIVSEAAITAARPLPSSSVQEIYFFETLSATHWGDRSRAFNPNFFHDISTTLEKKLKSLGVYHLEMRDFPHARSLKGIQTLAEFRGASVGLNAAEAFETFRIIKS